MWLKFRNKKRVERYEKSYKIIECFKNSKNIQKIQEKNT